MKRKTYLSYFSVCLLFLCVAYITHADDFSSTNFKVLSPVLTPGGYSTSNNYTLSGTFGEVAHNKASSASFTTVPGFFSFPFVTKAQLSAVVGNATGAVDLSWTASVPYLGYTVSGYKIGKSTSSGGPYTFTSVGNVLTSRVSGLINSTTYYFVVATLDSNSIVIATSSEVSAVPISPTLTFVVDSGTESFPSLSPGNLAATSSILSAITNNSTGYTVTLVRTNANTLILNSNPSITISDKTDWTAPGATTTVGPATASTTQPTTLQFRLWKAQTDIANYSTSWWGADDTTSGALFAGIPSTTQTIVNRSVSAPSTTTSRVLYDLNVPVSQQTGSYSGSISYSMTANP